MNGVIRYNTQTGRLGFYNNGNKAGEAMPIFRTFEEFENCPATSAELVYFYNQITGEGVTRFSDRRAGLRRIWKVISNGYQGKLHDTERIPMTTDENVLGDVELDLGSEGQERVEEAGSITGGETAREGENGSPEAPKGRKRANGKGSGAQKASGGQRKAKERSSGPDGSEAVASKRKGRTSSFEGRTLFPLCEVNPRRPGTHGFRSFELIREAGEGGLTFEDFIASGGRTMDLSWDITHEYVKVK